MKRYQVILIVLAIIAAVGFVGYLDLQSADTDREHYCAMTKLYDISNGREGWPPFDGSCK